VTEAQNNQKTQKISGRRFDAPLFVHGAISGEPERYLGEKPYELSKFEFSILKKGKFKSDTWFRVVCGATIGLVLAIVGKLLYALMQKQPPLLDNWELCSVGAGIVLAFILKFRKKTPEEAEFDEVRNYIEQYFKETPRRRIHVTGKNEDQ